MPRDDAYAVVVLQSVDATSETGLLEIFMVSLIEVDEELGEEFMTHMIWRESTSTNVWLISSNRSCGSSIRLMKYPLAPGSPRIPVTA
jgi:hypothetical protein